VIRWYENNKVLFDELDSREADIRAVLGSVRGFSAYYAIRTETGGATVTVCEDRSGTEESSRVAAEWVRTNLPAASGAPPQIIEGEVLFTA
jgi:hypothetical protein